MTLPIIRHTYQLTTLPCNKCGECCRNGGQCVLRVYGHKGPDAPSIDFRGQCDMLREESDGTYTCTQMEKHPELVPKYITGFCDWGQFRRELVPKGLQKN